MSTPPPAPKRARSATIEDRRAPEGAVGTGAKLNKLKGALRRPIAIERRGSQLHVVLVDRRRAPSEDAPQPLKQVCAELRARLLAHEAGHAAELMQQLVLVHDVLAQRGWRGVEGLGSRVLARALSQAEWLARDEASPALTTVVERLRIAQVAAQLREERRANRPLGDDGQPLEITEATAEEFDQLERSWVGTVPSELASAQDEDDDDVYPPRRKAR